MNHNHISENVNTALPELLNALFIKGDKFDSRAGQTLELMHVGITLRKPWQREIVLPDRKANIAAQIVETMWVLSGRNDVAGLSHYLPRAIDFSDDGLEWRAGYGPRLRNYRGVDQLAYIVATLSDNPSSRQAVATIWDPGVDTLPGKDIACNNWLSFSARNGKLDLHVGIRSNDVIWGWSGINAFEWSAMLELVAGLTQLEVGALHFSVTSFHMYDQHWDRAHRIVGNGYIWANDSPRFGCTHAGTLSEFDELAKRWFALEKEIRTGTSYRDDVDHFPEPMLRSWLRVLQWYWTGSEGFLDPIRSTRLQAACMVGITPPGEPQAEQLKTVEDEPEDGDFLDYVNRLHAQKHQAYGDSWKRRGEYMILANIARKVDRIEGGLDTSDETQTDTAIDLMVYLAKYRSWLAGGEGNPDEVRTILRTIPGTTMRVDIVNSFNRLEKYGERETGDGGYVMLVDDLLTQAYTLALSLWPGK